MILPIYVYGQPVLRKEAEEVERVRDKGKGEGGVHEFCHD